MGAGPALAAQHPAAASREPLAAHVRPGFGTLSLRVAGMDCRHGMRARFVIEGADERRIRLEYAVPRVDLGLEPGTYRLTLVWGCRVGTGYEAPRTSRTTATIVADAVTVKHVGGGSDEAGWIDAPAGTPLAGTWFGSRELYIHGRSCGGAWSLTDDAYTFYAFDLPAATVGFSASLLRGAYRLENTNRAGTRRFAIEMAGPIAHDISDPQTYTVHGTSSVAELSSSAAQSRSGYLRARPMALVTPPR